MQIDDDNQPRNKHFNEHIQVHVHQNYNVERMSRKIRFRQGEGGGGGGLKKSTLCTLIIMSTFAHHP